MQPSEPSVIASSERLRLRETRLDDLDFVLQLESDPENTPYIASWPRERHAQAIGDLTEAHWILESLDDGARIGYVIIQEIGAETGVRLRRIAVARKGVGLGHETVEMVKKTAFLLLGANRLWLDVQPHNDRAMHVYESCGFAFNGEIHQHVRGNDVVCRVMDISVDTGAMN